MSTDQHFYLGIDLGTTNSCMHWGAIIPNTNRIEPRALEFDQVTSGGSVERRALLPSYIWFRQGEELPVLGEFARTRGLEAQPSRVARNIKNHMGEKDWKFSIDDHSYTAVELTALLLGELFAGIRKSWQIAIPDVVITVPASFDSDMRAATLEAARRSGFKTLDGNGAARNLLLDEPRAALYDLLHQQVSGNIPRLILDLATPKTVLVFDLGGGTLDVSLHRVSQPTEDLFLGVEDLAISRYTQLGGGVFDSLLADELQRRFENRWNLKLDRLPASERNQVRVKFEVQAEQVKQRLTNDIDARLQRGAESVPDDYAIDVQMPFLYDNKGLIMRLTKKEFEDIIRPLLGWELDRSAVANFDPANTPSHNIIYPILDVLHKASLREGSAPSVDAVVLNGGMTRVQAIRDRLEEFFGIKPITVLDPERAVSRGAAIYHHLLHRGLHPTQILAESIGVEVEGDTVFHLIPAGTVLPYQGAFTKHFSIASDNARSLSIPLYRGEGKTPGAPNKKLLERRVQFSEPQPAGTSVAVDVSIDENKIVTFTALLPNGEQAVFQVGADGITPEDHSEKPPAPKPVTPVPSKPAIDPVNFGRQFRSASTSRDTRQLKELGKQALAASNIADLISVLLYELPTLSGHGRYRAYWICGEFAQRWPDSPAIARIVDLCTQQLVRLPDNPSMVNTVVRAAVEALGKTGSQVAESHLIRLLVDSRSDAIRPSILMALGKCARTGNAVKHISTFAESARDGERINAMWALGKLGSREDADIVPIRFFVDVLPTVCKHALRANERHIDVRQFSIFALGEIGDRRNARLTDEVIDEQMAAAILKTLEQVRIETDRIPAREIKQNSQHEHLRRLSEIAAKQIRGESLTDEETRILMSVRTLMALSG